MPYKIILIPFNKKNKTFNTKKLNKFCNNNKIISKKVEFFMDKETFYWSTFIEFEPILNTDAYPIKNIEQIKMTYKITDREKEVIQNIITGSSNKEIGELMNISERTVKAHISSIYSKLGVEKRVQLLNQIRNFNAKQEI